MTNLSIANRGIAAEIEYFGRAMVKMMRHAFWMVCFVPWCLALATTPNKSTDDLSFLLGSWDVTWTYQPTTDQQKMVNGTMKCSNALNETYIYCQYRFDRVDAPEIVENVYYNYNSIYDRYESVWISATWPIKVVMGGSLETRDGALVLSIESEFPIDGGITEYVRSELRFQEGSTKHGRFVRDTHIRTSEDAEEIWQYHLQGIATRTAAE